MLSQVVPGEDEELIKSMLSSDFMIVENWFFENYMYLNPVKCYFMCIGKNVSDSELRNLNEVNFKKCTKRLKFWASQLIEI